MLCVSKNTMHYILKARHQQTSWNGSFLYRYPDPSRNSTVELNLVITGEGNCLPHVSCQTPTWTNTCLSSIEPFWITLVTHSDIQIPIRWLLFTKCIPKCHMQTSAILFRFGRALPYYNYNYTSNVFARTIVIFIRNDGCSILFNVLQRWWLWIICIVCVTL